MLMLAKIAGEANPLVGRKLLCHDLLMSKEVIADESIAGESAAAEPVAAESTAAESTATESAAAEPMVGGVNTVLKIGDRVHRPAGEWTPAVHALLKHLAAKGFSAAPRVHGFDAEGREIVDFVPGDVPGSEVVVSDEALAAMAVLLRDLHDATADFVAPSGAAWYFEPREPAEVICHGDVAPYNTVFRDGRPVALIDFDTAHPAPRVWDVAYAAYRFVQLVADGASAQEKARRLAIFADAYGVGKPDRAALIDTVITRLRHLVGFLHSQAAAGHSAFARHVAEGHDIYYLQNITYIDRHRRIFDAALG